MKVEKPLVSAQYLLEKFPGKGGWTYAVIPEILQNKNNPFGWVKVKGNIDSYQLKQYKLMPMGGGKLFLPVKAAIRKQIKKQAGDHVSITLYSDQSVLVIPEEIIACFENEPAVVYQKFFALKEGEQKSYLDWINAAKTDETKANRILNTMDRVKKGLRFHDKVDL